MSNLNSLYTVWVGGVEVNDHLLNHHEANSLKAYYEDLGYSDVAVETFA